MERLEGRRRTGSRRENEGWLCKRYLILIDIIDGALHFWVTLAWSMKLFY